MPELPEVETVARQLAPLLTGRSVRGLRILDPRLRRPGTPRLTGRTIRDVSRSGKRVLVELSPAAASGSPAFMAVHLRMTGRLIWAEAFPAESSRHLRARMQLDRGELRFYDARRFGTFDWYRSASAAAPTGHEPLSDALTVGRLRRLIDGSGQELKAWLLRQDRLVGLGNIYASEILWAARLSPFRAAGSLDAQETRRLRNSTRKILRRAIRNCGTTFSDFQDARGVEGSYQSFLAVYGRDGQPCSRCGTSIERAVQQQRSTFFCRGCQG